MTPPPQKVEEEAVAEEAASAEQDVEMDTPAKAVTEAAASSQKEGAADDGEAEKPAAGQGDNRFLVCERVFVCSSSWSCNIYPRTSALPPF